MLRLENIQPGALEKLGAGEERRLRAKAPRWLGWRMDDGSPAVGGAANDRDELRDPPHPGSAMPAASDGLGRQMPGEWVKVCGDSMAGHGLRHGDRVRIDQDLSPSDGDIVLAEVEGVGRALRKLSIIGGVPILSADAGLEPIVVEDLSQLTYHGVVTGKPAR